MILSFELTTPMMRDFAPPGALPFSATQDCGAGLNIPDNCDTAQQTY